MVEHGRLKINFPREPTYTAGDGLSDLLSGKVRRTHTKHTHTHTHTHTQGSRVTTSTTEPIRSNMTGTYCRRPG